MDHKALQEWVSGRGSIMAPPIPRIECMDGLTMSIQAGEGIYSTPRTFIGPFSAMEIGFPSEKIDEFMEWAEDPENPTDTVYSYVPVEIILKVINSRGGAK